jgi:hypothetical protein
MHSSHPVVLIRDSHSIEKSVKTTYIVGDSMIKHLDCHRLKRSVLNGNKRVHAETYRGATTDAMQYHIMQCNTILSHVSKEILTKSFYTSQLCFLSLFKYNRMFLAKVAVPSLLR